MKNYAAVGVSFIVVCGSIGCVFSESCDVRCHWVSWESWDSCSQTCGGGSKNRSRSLCCDTDWSFSECASKCGKDKSDAHQSAACNTGCYHGGHYNGYDCTCTDSFYGGCCNSRCPDIANCIFVKCSFLWNNVCTYCEDNNVLFKKTNGDRTCERMCACNNHYCWPGTCGASKLTKDCDCADGFHLVTNAGETTCQLLNKPSIETCDFIVAGPNGEKKRASQTGTSSACQYKGDVFGNFQPKVVEYDYLSHFAVDASAFPTKPDFIVESNFGVTDASIISQKRGMDGSTLNVSPRVVISHYDAGQAVKPEASKGDNIMVSSVLKDGDRLCLTYEAKGGGYLIATTTTSPRTLQRPVSYSETMRSSKELCYKFDNTPPKHCLEAAACTNEPMQLNQRVVRTPIVTINFDGWFDPIPGGGDASQSSGIDLFDITVNEVPGVQGSNAPLKVSLTMITNAIVPSSVKSVTLNLTSERPILYCITLTVKDVADNMQTARRFVLYDNTSYITSRPAKTFHVTSASVETNFTWQTHHNDVCLNWKEYFFNKVYFDNPVLGSIAAEPNGLIKLNSVYEQTNGLLPVSGTPNVDGIIEYKLYWSLNGGTMSKSVPVSNFQDQSICKSFAPEDGQTYLLRIQAIDIVNNTYAENRTVHIDRSVPQINRVWLIKDGYKRLYVHDSNDLAQMTLDFEALDPHSGIIEVQWTFGSGDGVGELGNGTVSVDTVGRACADTSTSCYCPDVGQCEMYNYSIILNSHVSDNKHRGDHNKNYYFTITVTNHARLSNTEHVDILIDYSSPKHCLEAAACTNEPMQLNQRVVRTPIVTLNFDGWFDPIPGGGDASQASGIDLYDISVNEVPGVQGSNAPLKVSLTMITNAIVPSSVKSVTLNLTSERPILYCITLTVKDYADNVQTARRFVLYDNTSYITSRPAKTFHVTSATVETNFTWQTHHNDVCLNWKEYFFNKVYFDNPVLGSIAAEPNGLIKRNSVYEQTNGLLPVWGTPNVDGIIEYNLYWSLNGGTMSKSVPVSHFQDQSICKSFALEDGQTYILRIQAIDIVNNTYAEHTTVHIDRSDPQINKVWLTKDGYKRLYVRDINDLAQMTLEFEALDPHSGIREVQWTFGAGDGVGEVGNGAVSVDTVGRACADTSSSCYCPDVGQCEMYNYSIILNSLVADNKHRGDHNRNYYFTITVTNHAWLSSTEHVDILVDDSPPKPGIVNEGDGDQTSSLLVPIVGGVVGALAVVCVIVLVGIGLCKRRYRLNQSRTPHVADGNTRDESTTSPYEMPDTSRDDDVAPYDELSINHVYGMAK